MRRFVRIIVLLGALAPVLLGAAPPKCAVCGVSIRGRYISSGGRNYCSEACWERTLPKCAVCGAVIRGEHFRKDGRFYCSRTCFAQTLPKCDLCRTPLTGKYQVCSTPDGQSTKLCMTCAGQARCFACQRPGPTTVLPDGRAICPECAAERLSPEEEKRLFAEIRGRLERLLGTEFRCPLKFYTLDEVRLKRRLPRDLSSGGNRELGFCQSRMDIRGKPGRRSVSGYDCTVFMLDNLPRRVFIDTAAHELAHHWQYHRFPFLKNDPLNIREGFAEYAASLIDRVYGQPEMNRRKTNHSDPVYRDGFLFYRKLAEEGGMPAVFRYMREQSEP